MKLHLALFLVLSWLIADAACASDAAWMFLPAYYTHSPVTGERVAQYAPERPSLVPIDPTYQESGYRHQYVQGSTEILNLVQTWGMGTAIRPYGEWEFPYRAGATPFGPWGNPQGPWTLPFDSWQNPFALNRPSWGYGGWNSAYDGPAGNRGWQPRPNMPPSPSPRPMPRGQDL